MFAGYGIEVPEGKDLSYDSFFGLDLRGKVALVLRYFPEERDQELRVRARPATPGCATRRCMRAKPAPSVCWW